MRLSKKAIDFGAGMALIIAMLVLIIGVTVGGKIVTDLKSGESKVETEYVINAANASDANTGAEMTGSWTYTTKCKPVVGTTVYANNTQTATLIVNKTLTSATTGTILVTGYNWNATKFGKNLTFQYTCGNAAAVANSGGEALTSFAGFLPIIGTILAVFIVLGIVFAFKDQFVK